MAKRRTISQFDPDAMRRIAQTVRRVENDPLREPQPSRASDARGLQICFGITCADSGDSYPSPPASVFHWKPLKRRPDALTVGDQEIAEVASTERRKGVAFFGGYLAEDVVVEAYRIGGQWWLRPFPGTFFGVATSAITARVGATPGSGTAKIYSLHDWSIVQRAGADWEVNVKNPYAAEIESGTALTIGVDNCSGHYGVAGADCA